MLRYLVAILLLMQSSLASNISKREDNVSQKYILYAKDYDYVATNHKEEGKKFHSIKIEKIENFNKSFPLPDKGSLDYFSWGFNKAYKYLYQSNTAYKVEFKFNQKKHFLLHKKVQEYLYELSKEAKGYIMDSATRELYTPEAWRERRVEKGWHQNKIVLPYHIAMHYYEYEEGKKRIVTLGMEKFGLPDISINDVFSAQASHLGTIINLCAYMLLEENNEGDSINIKLKDLGDDPYIASIRNSIEGKVSSGITLKLKYLVPMEGDADNRALEILFPKDKRETSYATQARYLDALFGSDDKVYDTRKYNEELKAASLKSRMQLPSLKERFNKGLLPGEQISLKAPFVYSGGTEWMWVVVVKWGKKKIKGILNNTPFYIKSLKAGDTVEIDENEVFDYIYTHEDGTETGNETGKIIEKYQK